MPNPIPSAAHVAAAEEIYSAGLIWTREQAVTRAAAILARHFPSPPPVQEFAALAAAAEARMRSLRDVIAGTSKLTFNEMWEIYERFVELATPSAVSALVAALGRERADKLVFAKCLENVASVAMTLSNYYWNGRTDRHEPLPERSAEHVAHWWKKLGEAFDSCTSKGSQLQCDILHKARQVIADAAVTSENSQNSFRKED